MMTIGLREHESPLGEETDDKLMLPAKPLRLFRIIVATPESPELTVIVPGSAWIEKSVILSIRLAVRLRLPLVPVTATV